LSDSVSLSLLWYSSHGRIFHVPILVPIQESREDTVQVCACADKEQDDEEERLELEDAELDGYAISVRGSRIFGRKTVVPLLSWEFGVQVRGVVIVGQAELYSWCIRGLTKVTSC
jgi:hypothetical protein